MKNLNYIQKPHITYYKNKQLKICSGITTSGLYRDNNPAYVGYDINGKIHKELWYYYETRHRVNIMALFLKLKYNMTIISMSHFNPNWIHIYIPMNQKDEAIAFKLKIYENI